jgi:hypothetical protein
LTLLHLVQKIKGIYKALAILEKYFSNYVSDSIFWLFENIISMTTTTIHIRSVFVDSFTIR